MAMSVLLQMLGENHLPTSASCKSLRAVKFNHDRASVFSQESGAILQAAGQEV